MNTNIKTLAVSAALLTAANAASISIAFTDGGSGPQTTTPGVSGGVESVIGSSWNQFGGTGLANQGTSDSTNLMNELGAGTGAGVTISGFTAAWWNSAASGAESDASTQVVINYVEINSPTESASISLTNIPFANYDVILYSLSDGSTSGITATIGGTTQTMLNVPSGDFAANGFVDGTNGTGNYMVFSGLSGANFDITDISGHGSNLDKAAVGGIQIVEIVPEPSSAALLGLGGFSLILRRRK